MPEPGTTKRIPAVLASARTRKLGVVFLMLGSAGLALSFWGLWRDVGWIAQAFYMYAWWSYIFLLDGFTALRRGNPLFTRHLRKVCRIALWSVTFWFFFEHQPPIPVNCASKFSPHVWGYIWN